MYYLLLVFLLLCFLSSSGQDQPDSIVVVRNTYGNNFTDADKLYQAERFSIIKKGNTYISNNDRITQGSISNLLSAIKDPSNTNNALSKYQVDTSWIKNNPEKLLRFYDDKDRIAWNDQQKEFIFQELTDLHNYSGGLNDYLSDGCCYTMHRGYKYEYTVKFFNAGRITEEIRSRRFVWGYKMPWTNQSGDTLYNHNIETALAKIIEIKEKTNAPLKGNKLLAYLVNEIIDNNMRRLYELSAHSYKKEIDELNSEFKVVSFEEVYGRGRYIWDEPKTMKIVLKNDHMPDNVNMVFLASQHGNKLYSRDSIKKDYKEYVDRIQSIHFITNFLKANPNTRLDIYYFNNKGINEYNIRGVNKSPEEWKKHDDYVSLLRRIRSVSLDAARSIELSERNYCGCNYRFDRNYIEQAIFFEMRDNEGNSSVWFLLPDDKVLLYIMEGSKVLNFNRSDFGGGGGLLHPCVLFDKEGNRIAKPVF